MNVAVTSTAEPKVSAPNPSYLLLSNLPRDLGVRVRELHTKVPAWNLVCVLYPLAWVVTAVTVQWLSAGRVGILQWAIRVAGIILIGIFIQAIAILMHEALHGNLFQSARLNRWAMFAFGLPAPPRCLIKNVTGCGRCLTGDVTGEHHWHHAASTTWEGTWPPR